MPGGNQIFGAYLPTLWGDLPDGYVPIITEFSWKRTIQGYNFLPRLLGWYKYQCPSNTPAYPWAHCNALTIWGTWINQSITSQNAVAAPGFDFNTWPMALPYNRNDINYPIAQSLTYGTVSSRAFDCSVANNWDGPTEPLKGLFQNYYQEMIEMAKDNGRVRTVYIDLKISDIVNLDFRKLVYMDGTYWRINKIIDYQPNNNHPTQVELVQHLFQSQKAATREFPVT